MDEIEDGEIQEDVDVTAEQITPPHETRSEMSISSIDLQSRLSNVTLSETSAGIKHHAPVTVSVESLTCVQIQQPPQEADEQEMAEGRIHKKTEEIRRRQPSVVTEIEEHVSEEENQEPQHMDESTGDKAEGNVIDMTETGGDEADGQREKGHIDFGMQFDVCKEEGLKPLPHLTP